MTTPTRPRVIIIGGGFAGLTAARGLASAQCDITLLDRRNHHLFQPLLYQVATAALSPAQIAAPIRRILRSQRNATVLLAEVDRIDPSSRTVHLKGEVSPFDPPGPASGSSARLEISYDYLILAAGVTHSYFGRDDWAALAPGLKSVEDATAIRAKFLTAFEAAERSTDPYERRYHLTFIVVGGGPTGVELAGAMAEIARSILTSEFRAIRTETARVILVEANERVLSSYPPDLSARAKRDLESLGVQVLTSSRVTQIDQRGVQIRIARGPDLPANAPDPEPLRVDAATVVWAAGVKASPLAASLGVPLDRAGRVLVNADLSIPSHSEVFVAGDLASIMQHAAPDKPVPGVAPAAMQMGRHVARVIRAELVACAQGQSPPARAPFVYVNKGELATIGRNKAVGVLGFGLNFPFAGFFAWLFWALIHVTYLIGFRNRVLVMFDWVWSYVFFSRGARLITTDQSSDAASHPPAR